MCEFGFHAFGDTVASRGNQLSGFSSGVWSAWKTPMCNELISNIMIRV